MANMRLDKFFSEQGICTRSEIKKELKRCAVTVNGVVVKKPEIKIDPKEDIITYYGNEIGYQKYVYYMMNKPQDVVSATQDNLHMTVIDVFWESELGMELIDLSGEKRREIFPVGRLDIDTEGLLILTDDGALSHDLLTPSKHIDKTYYVEVEGELTQKDVHAFSSGMDIGEKKPTKSARLKILSTDGETSRAKVTLTEGKFHQIKRMFEKVEKPVTFLKRISMGEVVLDENLLPGEVRPLTETELELLQR